MPIATTSLPFLGEIFNRIITNVYNLSLCHVVAMMTEVRQECQYDPQMERRQVPAANFWLLLGHENKPLEPAEGEGRPQENLRESTHPQ
jgi:hypothetical protein